MSAKEPISGPDVPLFELPFSAAIRANGFVFVSGQASTDSRSGDIIVDTFEGEMRRSFEHVRKILRGAGCDLQDIVQVRSYVGRRAYLAEYNRLYREIMPKPFPARTTLIDCLGDDLKYEVDVVALIPSELR